MDLISRQAAIDAPEEFIKDCNPEHFVGHQKFIEYMDNAEIGSFGNWQFANGFNMGLTAAEVAIKKLPSAQPEPSQVAREICTILENEQDMRVILKNAQPEQLWIPVSERLPDEKEIVLITFDERVEMGRMCGESWEWLFESGWDYWIDIDNVTAWMPLPEPYKEEER